MSLKICTHEYGEDFDRTADIVMEKDGWNDYGYETKYRVFRNLGSYLQRIGSVKICCIDADDSTSKITRLDHIISEVPINYVSLGQSQGFYESLYEIGADFARDFLESIRDMNFFVDLYDEYVSHPVVSKSLTRDIAKSDISQFRRLSKGDHRKISYNFDYHIPNEEGDTVLNFSVDPNKDFSSNLHAIIGANGAGKTTIFNDLVDIIGSRESDFGASIEFSSDDVKGSDHTELKKIVFVSFSVFDQEKIALKVSRSRGVRSDFVGLLAAQGADHKDDELVEEAEVCEGAEEATEIKLMSREDLFDVLLESTKQCLSAYNRKRWIESISELAVDSIFESFNFSELLSVEDVGDIEAPLKNIFDRCSSGHAISLLAVTRLIELVDERTLVLFDEPESHLHPPLLSALLNVVSNISRDRNSIAIVATHSPVVLQEIPKVCVWLLSRSGNVIDAYRPEIETFGENVGVLTREVFELHLKKTGYNRLIRDMVSVGRSREEILKSFDSSLGSEARALLSTLISKKK